MESIFSQGDSQSVSRNVSIIPYSPLSQTMSRAGRRKKSAFRPPIKAREHDTDCSQLTETQQSTDQGGDQGGREVCHTVLSYCEEEEEEERTDTQPLSMFSGEGEREYRFPLDDDAFSKLDDPLSSLDSQQSSSDLKLDDPFSDPLAPGGGSDDEGGEQCVPVSPASTTTTSQQLSGETAMVDTEDPEEQGDIDRQGRRTPLRRTFKTRPRHRQYNLELLPRQYRKRPAASATRARARPSVNWSTSVSVIAGRERPRATGGAGSSLMSVYEVPLSGGSERGGEGGEERPANQSSRSLLSRLDVSHTSRTREEQVRTINYTDSWHGVFSLAFSFQ